MNCIASHDESNCYMLKERNRHLVSLGPFLPVVVVAATLFFLGVPTAVLAHGDLIDADPTPGAALGVAPSELRLTFSEPNSAESKIELYGVGFQKIDDVHTSVNPDKPEQLIATIPSLDKGRYTVQWQVISQDGHELRGSYAFEVILGAQDESRSNTWIYYGWLALLVAIALMVVRLVVKVGQPLTLKE